jgi:hypothetical protein
MAQGRHGKGRYPMPREWPLTIEGVRGAKSRQIQYEITPGLPLVMNCLLLALLVVTWSAAEPHLPDCTRGAGEGSTAVGHGGPPGDACPVAPLRRDGSSPSGAPSTAPPLPGAGVDAPRWVEDLLQPSPVPVVQWEGDAGFLGRLTARGTPVVIRGSPAAQWPARAKWSPTYLAAHVPNVTNVYVRDGAAGGGFSYYDPVQPLQAGGGLGEGRARGHPDPDPTGGFDPGWRPSHRVVRAMPARTFFRMAAAAAGAPGCAHPWGRGDLEGPPVPAAPEAGAPSGRGSAASGFDWVYYSGDLAIWPRALQEDVGAMGPFTFPGVPQAVPVVWMGAAGVRTGAHYDAANNLYAQLAGRKRFLLLPPGAAGALYLHPKLHAASRQARVGPLMADHWVRDWDGDQGRAQADGPTGTALGPAPSGGDGLCRTLHTPCPRPSPSPPGPPLAHQLAEFPLLAAALRAPGHGHAGGTGEDGDGSDAEGPGVGLGAVAATLYPGDLLFLPAYWFHEVLALYSSTATPTPTPHPSIAPTPSTGPTLSPAGPAPTGPGALEDPLPACAASSLSVSISVWSEAVEQQSVAFETEVAPLPFEAEWPLARKRAAAAAYVVLLLCNTQGPASCRGGTGGGAGGAASRRRGGAPEPIGSALGRVPLWALGPLDRLAALLHLRYGVALGVLGGLRPGLDEAGAGAGDGGGSGSASSGSHSSGGATGSTEGDRAGSDTGGGGSGDPSPAALAGLAAGAGDWACGSGEPGPGPGPRPVLAKLRRRAARLAGLFGRLPRDVAQLYLDNWVEEVAAWAMGPADDAVAREEAQAASGTTAPPPSPLRAASQEDVRAFLAAAVARCDPPALYAG